MIIRLFDTAVDPDDIEKGTQLFREEVRPAFEAFPGCHGIEMLVGIEEHSGDVVEIVAVSRWESFEAIERAVEAPEYEDALAGIRLLFRQAPIVRHFEAIE